MCSVAAAPSSCAWKPSFLPFVLFGRSVLQGTGHTRFRVNNANSPPGADSNEPCVDVKCNMAEAIGEIEVTGLCHGRAATHEYRPVSG